MSFEQFSEGLENVPPELERNFTLMTELDKRTEEVMLRINECVKEYEETRDKEQRDNLKSEAADLFEKLSSYADDKIEKAEKTYEMIDKNIKKLTSLGVQATGGIESPIPIGFDMPLDPNEPRYCICQGVSHGDMVGCDNKECPIEWFHYPCVGLRAAPRGKWYCQQCIGEWKKNHQKSRNSKKRKH